MAIEKEIPFEVEDAAESEIEPVVAVELPEFSDPSLASDDGQTEEEEARIEEEKVELEELRERVDHDAEELRARIEETKSSVPPEKKPY